MEKYIYINKMIIKYNNNINNKFNIYNNNQIIIIIILKKY